jgi:hypothetical protein
MNVISDAQSYQWFVGPNTFINANIESQEGDLKFQSAPPALPTLFQGSFPSGSVLVSDGANVQADGVEFLGAANGFVMAGGILAAKNISGACSATAFSLRDGAELDILSLASITVVSGVSPLSMGLAGIPLDYPLPAVNTQFINGGCAARSLFA